MANHQGLPRGYREPERTRVEDNPRHPCRWRGARRARPSIILEQARDRSVNLTCWMDSKRESARYRQGSAPQARGQGEYGAATLGDRG